MLNQISALLYIYFKDQNGELEYNRFIQYCEVIGFLNFLGFFLNAFEQNPKTKGNSFKIIVELICSLLGLVLILSYYYIYFMELSINSISMLIGLIYIWANECSLYYFLSDKGLYSMLNLFITTNVLLTNGNIALRGSGQLNNLFDYSSINLIVLCVQFSWSGEPNIKNKNNLFQIISGQDCFRLIVCFLLFNILNNTIKSFLENTYEIIPTLITLIPYIWATIKFNQRRYKLAFGLFLFCLIIYFPIDIQIKQQYQLQKLQQLEQLEQQNQL
ncbi:unnamed protein product [Paramecium primaurelia]|uniref:Transmembrane protein n=1 Tax=Paramecium primaurelia TaxID=5886 RepID=A0A8S1Q0F5_PARPR|nr:unnamed protein product [Paramecium primaurelia]